MQRRRGCCGRSEGPHPALTREKEPPQRFCLLIAAQKRSSPKGAPFLEEDGRLGTAVRGLFVLQRRCRTLGAATRKMSATATTAASGRNREELLGQRPGCACRPRHKADAGSRNPGSDETEDMKMSVVILPGGMR